MKKVEKFMLENNEKVSQFEWKFHTVKCEAGL